MDNSSKMRKAEVEKTASDNKRFGEMAAGVIARAARFGKPLATVQVLCG